MYFIKPLICSSVKLVKGALGGPTLTPVIKPIKDFIVDTFSETENIINSNIYNISHYVTFSINANRKVNFKKI